jgi:hypothetical protein
MERPSKIYPNLDFWLENKPSGNPGFEQQITSLKRACNEERIFCSEGDVIGRNIQCRRAIWVKTRVAR